MTIYLEDMGKVIFPFEPEEQIKQLAAFATDFVKCHYEQEISVICVRRLYANRQKNMDTRYCESFHS